MTLPASTQLSDTYLYTAWPPPPHLCQPCVCPPCAQHMRVCMCPRPMGEGMEGRGWVRCPRRLPLLDLAHFVVFFFFFSDEFDGGIGSCCRVPPHIIIIHRLPRLINLTMCSPTRNIFIIFADGLAPVDGQGRLLIRLLPAQLVSLLPSPLSPPPTHPPIHHRHTPPSLRANEGPTQR